jgi:hypothetical protein
MKTRLIQTAVAVLTLAAACYAQSTPLQVTVPFDFVAGSRTYSAGQYTVLQPVATSVVAIRPDGSQRGIFMLAIRVESGAAQKFAKLVFHRYGDRYFLSEVWDMGRSSGSQLPKTAQERELAQNSQSAPVTRIVAAR